MTAFLTIFPTGKKSLEKIMNVKVLFILEQNQSNGSTFMQPLSNIPSLGAQQSGHWHGSSFQTINPDN